MSSLPSQASDECWSFTSLQQVFVLYESSTSIGLHQFLHKSWSQEPKFLKYIVPSILRVFLLKPDIWRSAPHAAPNRLATSHTQVTTYEYQNRGLRAQEVHKSKLFFVVEEIFRRAFLILNCLQERVQKSLEISGTFWNFPEHSENFQKVPNSFGLFVINRSISKCSSTKKRSFTKRKRYYDYVIVEHTMMIFCVKVTYAWVLMNVWDLRTTNDWALQGEIVWVCALSLAQPGHPGHSASSGLCFY